MPYYGHPPAPCLIPKRHEPGALREGQMVFYRGQRFWIENAPETWDRSTFVRIGDHKVPPREDLSRPLPQQRLSFCVPADAIDLIPEDYITKAKRLPTVASVERTKRLRAGARDVGDEVATLLRKCSSLEETYKTASEYLGVPEAELLAKYGHLNPGQQRMNLGNKMRFKWKKEHLQ